MVREPAVAGQFYEGSKDGLINQVKQCFTSDFGPRDMKFSGKIIGAVSPHAGFMCSGPGAAYVYKAIKESRTVDTFVILAPNHTGRGRTSLTKETYSTPIGEVDVDVKLADEIMKNAPISDDLQSHVFEHSLEVQLPFIQYLFPKAKIVPIIVSGPYNLKEISTGIKESIEGKNVCIIASSDFTHYGFRFGFEPFDSDVRENIEKFDKKAISFIEKCDSQGFMDYVDRTGATICGYLPIMVMIDTIQSYKMKLLKYYTSSDILGSADDSSVSYASIVCCE